MQQKKFKVVALGCRTNQYEAQAIRDQFSGLGYVQANENEKADLYVVNTCTVTEQADSSSRHLIRSFIKENSNAEVIVTGCLADRDPKSVEAIKGVSKVVANKDKEFLVQALFPDQEVPEFAIKDFDSHTRAFVKVQDGCNSFCSYCIIPYVRGRSRSRSIEEIVQEVRQLVVAGFREVVLTGINIGDFDGGGGSGKSDRLADLVRAVDLIPGIKRVRISSIDPDEVDDDLLDAVINGKNCCPSMHIVLQSGSNAILKRMNRKYTRQMFLDTIRRLKNAHPDFTFTTDVIVGFPGESEQDFTETLEVVKAVGFAKVHVFPYSKRPRTKAALFPDHISHDVIVERKSRLLRVVEETAYQLRNQFVGRVMSVLTETPDGESGFGHTDNFLPVLLDQSIDKNQIVSVTILENRSDALFGKVQEGVELE
jgi:threonylcarbamoyladenosine tRNA methylthiotransferase MtaB